MERTRSPVSLSVPLSRCMLLSDSFVLVNLQRVWACIQMLFMEAKLCLAHPLFW